MAPQSESYSLLPSLILAGVGIIFVVLAAVLPVEQVVGLIAGSAMVVGIVVARLRRDLPENDRTQRFNTRT